MVFIKNVIKKKNIIGYVITLIIIIIFSLVFIVLNNYLKNYKYDINNKEEKRTIFVYNENVCNYKNSHIIYCELQDNGSKVVVDKKDNLNDVVTLFNDFDIMTYEGNDSDINTLIFAVECISILVFLSCVFIIIMLVVQYNKDDIKVNKILRCIGYSKLRLYFINCGLLFALMSFIFIFSFLLFLIIYAIFKINVEILLITKIFCLQYVVIIILIMFMYIITFANQNKNKIK